MWPRQQQAYKARIIKPLVAALVLLCVLQFLGRLGKETHNNAQLKDFEMQLADLDKQLPVDVLDSQDVEKKLEVMAALRDMTIFYESLTDLLFKIDQMYIYINLTVIPQQHDMELNLRAAGVSDDEMKELAKQLDTSSNRMIKRGADIRDDIESLQIKVRFIVEDLQYNLNNVVSSAYDYLVQFKKEFDQGYRNSRTYFELAVKNAGIYIKRALGNRRGKFADAVRAKLIEITSEIINKREEIDSSKKAYENIKEKALQSLKSVIK